MRRVETNVEGKLLDGLALLGAAIALMAALSGCSTGGYVSIGWTPVTVVKDVHEHDAVKYQEEQSKRR